MAWAFVTVNYRDQQLFAFLAIKAERLLKKFNAQSVANTSWAFAKMDCRSEKLFAALA